MNDTACGGAAPNHVVIACAPSASESRPDDEQQDDGEQGVVRAIVPFHPPWSRRLPVPVHRGRYPNTALPMATRSAVTIMIIQTQWPIRRGFGGRVLISGTMPASLTLRGQAVAVNLVPKYGRTPAARLPTRRKPAYNTYSRQ